jgi:hypothetical protein
MTARLTAGLLAGLTVTCLGAAAAAEERVLPERPAAVLVSNRDVNRLNCPQGVEDVVWSAEKPVKVSHAGENVFVKFLVARQGERETFATAPLDVHVICGGAVYTLILHPREMDSVTVRLGDTRRTTLQAVTKEWGSLPLEDRVKRLTLAVYRNQIPDTFTRRLIEPGDPRRSLAMYRNAQVVAQSEVLAPGLGLKAVEYVVIAAEPMQLAERDFLVPQLGEVVGITVEPLALARDEVARLIVIERSTTTAELP